MARPQVGEIINNISTDGKQLVQGNIELAKTEMGPMAKHAGIGTGLFSAAAYFALRALWLLFMAGGFGIGLIFTHFWDWSVLGGASLGFTIMAVLMLIITAILAIAGKGQFKHVGAPKQTIAEAQATMSAISTSIQTGLNDVTADANDRAALARAKKEARNEAKLAKQQAKEERQQAKAAAKESGFDSYHSGATEPSTEHYTSPSTPQASRAYDASLPNETIIVEEQVTFIEEIDDSEQPPYSGGARRAE